MKKNILTIIILALAFVNVILTALVVFVIVPTSNKTNKLISQVASVIELELESEAGGEGSNQIDVNNIDTSFIIEQALTMNLKKSPDGSEHFAMMDSISFSMDKSNKDYETYKDTMVDKRDIFTEMVRSVMLQYTLDQVYDHQSDIKTEVLNKIHNYYKSDFIIDISFGNFRFQ